MMYIEPEKKERTRKKKQELTEVSFETQCVERILNKIAIPFKTFYGERA